MKIIWFVKVTKQTVVWVANRNDPINDPSGVLSINQFGNLVLHDSFNRLLWSTNVSVQGTTSCVAQLQDSGNLMNPTCGSPQVALYKGSTLYWRLDPWPWLTSPPSSSTSVSTMGFKIDFVNNKDESSDDVNKFECTCLPGYELKSPKDWYHRDGSEGCVRKKLGLSMCGSGEVFVKVTRLKGADSFNAAWMDMSMSSSECKQACLNNC
nr:g-type lectin s-receptor-like serine/threonine-protein kinase [Quercus suber]